MKLHIWVASIKHSSLHLWWWQEGHLCRWGKSLHSNYSCASSSCQISPPGCFTTFPCHLFCFYGPFFVLPVACEKGNTQQQQHCSPGEQRGAAPALLGPSPIMHHGGERRNQRENSLNLSGERRGEWSCHWAILHLLPWLSAGKGAGSQPEGETTPTTSPPKATLIHCCR